HAARGGRGQRWRRLLALEPLLDVLLDFGERTSLQLQTAADQHGPRRGMEHAVREGAAARLELADGAVGVQEVDGRDEVADGAVLRPRVHGQCPADGGGNPDEALDPAEIQRGRLAEQRRAAGAWAGGDFPAVELGAAGAA